MANRVDETWEDDCERISCFDSEELEVESVDIQCGVNVEDGVDVEDGVNVEDGLNVDGGVNSSSRLEEPYIGKLFNDVEDAQAFYKAYARRVGFAIWTI
ncbi:hypothetical protein Q3G72_019092 [Acer saccharum]|nr:hypothetical protein Q3G72_019092 [Acer saccharum]